ncbi:PEP-CTERM protein-sorting domain-containing protein [Roseateles sp. YR242]|uniref:MHFG family PEP-CTERM protein n=1 Tax=Roseateles sp. YR242 TaxID=1855305 RepID=UPI0008C0B4BC|nr:MHFG family PEP-CTERM protein [Roseateles sp. YR242]SEL28642.1 PEP-CTERM protein-sorting domain-containing protein [Roseateles sp. YR242]
MSLVATVALAASSLTLPQCSWDRPGVNPFMGDLVAAVDRYKDIPAATRAKLKARMQERRYDEIVDIRRDAIVGRYDYDAAIRDMHFGTGQVCQTVSRAKWKDTTLERGLVYCEDGQCLLVPTVCRNVSRITRGPLKGAGAPVASTEEDNTPLMFDPPAAGAPNVEGGGAGNGDTGSFARASALSTPSVESLPVAGGYLTPPSAGPGLIVLPPNTSPTEIPSPPPAVPEPQTWALFALGLVALLARFSLKSGR